MNSNGCKINSHGLVEIIIFHDTGKIIIITTVCQVRSGSGGGVYPRSKMTIEMKINELIIEILKILKILLLFK